MLKGSKFARLACYAIGGRGGQYSLSGEAVSGIIGASPGEAYVIDGFEGLELKPRPGQGIPSRYVVLTVDKGHESALWVADFLGKHECQASFFLIRDRSASKPGCVRERDIRQLCRRGFPVGTHGTTPRGLTFLPKEHRITELAESERGLEDVIGEEIRYMAAPPAASLMLAS